MKKTGIVGWRGMVGSVLVGRMKEEREKLSMSDEMVKRAVNVGFSGGEKKRNEVLQMAMLKPRLAILDETDSGLDIDALKVVSTGVNALLIAICQELGVRAVLTTEVIPWARGAVKEIDVARRLMRYAVVERTPPKGVDDRLVTVKDPAILAFSEDELRALQARITDPNYRIFADREAITVFNSERFVRGTNIQEIFAALDVDEPSHAFYLGKELARASLAVSLGKTYRQEGALAWGYLTPPDDATSDHVRLSHTAKRTRR